VAISFEGIDSADSALNQLKGMQKEYLVDLEDACVVTRDGNGKLHLKQSIDLVKGGALSGASWGALWGLLIGFLFANPLIGVLGGTALGAGGGALSVHLSDYGIDDDFIKALGEKVTPETSALFLLVRKANPDKVLPELANYEGTILRTSLTEEQERKLTEALKAAA